MWTAQLAIWQRCLHKGYSESELSLCRVRAFFTRTLGIAWTIPSNSELEQHLDSVDWHPVRTLPLLELELEKVNAQSRIEPSTAWTTLEEIEKHLPTEPFDHWQLAIIRDQVPTVSRARPCHPKQAPTHSINNRIANHIHHHHQWQCGDNNNNSNGDDDKQSHNNRQGNVRPPPLLFLFYCFVLLLIFTQHHR